jgi:phage/plasmid-associated DNA primase
MDYLTGRFNSSFINKMFIICDEVSYQNDNYYVDMNRLKALITNDTIAVERKGLEVEEFENYSRLFIFSNNPRCLKLSTTDRRFAVFGTSDKYCKNKEYFDNLFKELNEDVADHFLTYLLKYDISKWNHNAIPNTEERRNMMMTNELEFLFYHFDNYDEEGRATTEIFYDSYLTFCSRNGIKAISKIKIIQSLRPYVESCKWNSGTLRGLKKLFTKTEDDQIIFNQK